MMITELHTPSNPQELLCDPDMSRRRISGPFLTLRLQATSTHFRATAHQLLFRPSRAPNSIKALHR